MSSPVQLKINLTSELQELLASKASKFGIPLTQYVKHVLMKDVEDIDYPTFLASETTDKEAKKALQDMKNSIEAKNFFKQFHNDR